MFHRLLLRYAARAFARTPSGYSLRVIFANGRGFTTAKTGEPDVTVRFNTTRAEWATILTQSIGFVEKYRVGEIDILGEDALRKLIRTSFELNTHGVHRWNPVAYVAKLHQEYTLNNKKYLREKKNLFAHYNMPAEFFHYMNGELYGYTEGYYETDREDQNEAQWKKYNYMCRRLMLKPGDHVVEVSTAWGTMALLMAKKYGCTVTNYGLIPEQNRILKSRAEHMGVAHSIHNEVRDCRELGREKGKYDKYVSLGVLEHAGKDCVEDWIKNISECLKEGGIGLITNVGHMERDYTEYVIGKYIWRGCYFPKMGDVLEYLEKYDLNLVDLEDTHFLYAQTMEVMLSKMLQHWDKIHALNPELFDEKFKRIWSVYYIGSIEGFRSRTSALHTFQYVFVKGRGQVYPKTREFLYKEPFTTEGMEEYFVPLGQDGFGTGVVVHGGEIAEAVGLPFTNNQKTTVYDS